MNKLLLSRNVDPFQVEPLPKAFYHPTKEKELTKKVKKVCLSVPSISQQQQVSSPEDLKFLNDPNSLKIQEIPTRENGSYGDQSSSCQFNESWPSTERTGSLGTPGSTPGSESTLSSPEMTLQMREWLTGQDLKQTTNNTTLGWYINRFRNAPPTSRQSRDRTTVGTNQTSSNFWWLSPTSGQSTPTLDQDTPSLKLKPSPPFAETAKKKLASKPPISTSTPTSLQSSDKTIDDLNKRAKGLLEKSESSLDTICTEPFPLPLKKPTCTKPKALDTMSKPIIIPTPHSADTTRTSPSLTTPRHNPWPEDDILYQWRLARKMEKAQEKASVMRPTGQHDLRSQPNNGNDKIGPLITPNQNSYGTIGAAGSSRILNSHDQYNILSPLENSHEELSNHLSFGDHDMNEPGSEAALGQVQQTNSFDSNTQQVSTSRQLTQGQTHSTNQHITASGPTRPLVAMTTVECTLPQCADTADNVTIATTAKTNRTIVTPIVAPPCQHGSTSSHSLRVQPHMHLACDIIPCPCSNRPAGRTKTNMTTGESSAHPFKQSHFHVDHKQNELIDSEDKLYLVKQKHSPPSGNRFSHDIRTSQTNTHLHKSSKETTDKASKDTFVDGKGMGSIAHNTKDISRKSEGELDEKGGLSRANKVNDSGGRGTYQSAPSTTDKNAGREKVGAYKQKGRSKTTTQASDIVDNVIGKVVSEHLFLGNSSSSESSQPVKKLPKQVQKEITPNDVRAFQQVTESLLVESSEEEFADDEILTMLRQRSRELKSQLREIDQNLQDNP